MRRHPGDPAEDTAVPEAAVNDPEIDLNALGLLMILLRQQELADPMDPATIAVTYGISKRDMDTTLNKLRRGRYVVETRGRYADGALRGPVLHAFTAPATDEQIAALRDEAAGGAQ